jgi:hypothetical protein
MATAEETPVRTKRTEESTYVIQVQHKVKLPEPGPDMPEMGGVAWLDVATVTVPARTKRKSVIRKGLKQAGLEITTEGMPARALDADSAHAYMVGMDQPEPQLRIA